MSRSTITIDLIIKGIENLDRLGRLFTALTSNAKFQRGFAALGMAIASVSQRMGMLFAAAGRMGVALARAAQDPRVVAGFKKIATVLKLIQREMQQTGGHTKSAQQRFTEFAVATGVVAIQLRSLSFMMRDIGLNLIKIAKSIFGVFQKIIEGGGGIELALSELQAILGEPSKQTDGFSKLADEIIRVGETTSFTVDQVAELATELARAGFSTREVSVALAGVVQLAEAGGLDAARAAEIASNTLRTFGMRAEEIGRVNDILVATAVNSNTTVEALGFSFSYVGPIAEAFGQSIEQVAAALGVLANSGIKGSTAGAGLAQIFSQLANRGEKADEILAKYGSSFDKVNPSVHSLIDILKEFENINFSTMDSVELFGTRAQRTFLALKNQGVEALQLMMDINKESAGIAANIANVRLDNVTGDILIMKSAFSTLVFEIFSAMADNLRQVVQYITTIIQSLKAWVADNQKLIGQIAEIAVSVAAFAAVAGSFFVVSGGLTLILATLVTVLSLIGTFAAVIASLAPSISLTLGGTLAAGFAILSPIILKAVAAVAVLGAAIALVGYVLFEVLVRVWDTVVTQIQRVWNGYMKPLLASFAAGFMFVYKNIITPMFDFLAYIIGYIITTIADVLTSPAVVEIMSWIAAIAGFLAGGALLAVITAIAVSAASILIPFLAIGTVLSKIVTWTGSWFNWLSGRITPSVEELNAALQQTNDIIRESVEEIDSFRQSLSTFEAVDSLAAKLFELEPNQLDQLKENLQDLVKEGFTFDEASLNTLSDQIKLRKEKVKVEVDLATVPLGFRGGQYDAVSEAARAALSTNQQLLKDLEKQEETVARIARTMAIINETTQASDFNDLVARREEMLKRILAIALEENAAKLELVVISKQTGLTDQEKNARREIQNQKLKDLGLEKEKLNEQQKFMAGIATEAELLILKAGNLVKITDELKEQGILEAKKVKDAGELLLLEEEMLESAERRKELLDDIRKESLSGIEKERFEAARSARDRFKDLNEQRAMANLALTKTSDPAKMKDIQDQIADINNTARAVLFDHQDDLKKIYTDSQEKITDTLLEARLKQAKNDKDMDAQILLEREKFNKETEEIIKQDFANQAAQADEFRKLRGKELSSSEKGIRDQFAKDAQAGQKKAIDRSKELVDTENKGLEILLSKVQNTRDLVALNLAMMKIQRMRDNEAINQMKKALAAEEAVNRTRAKMAEAAAAGQDPGKFNQELKKREGLLMLRRAGADRARAGAGADQTDPAALSAARTGLDLTSNDILNKIALTLSAVDGAFLTIQDKFAQGAIAWVDAFLISWNIELPRLLNAVAGGLGGVTIPVPTARGGQPAAGQPAGPTTGAAGTNITMTINNNIDNQEFMRKFKSIVPSLNSVGAA